MPRLMHCVAVACTLAPLAPGQELLWQRIGTSDQFGSSRIFGDFDRDGYDDLLCSWDHSVTGGARYDLFRILSGQTGAVISDRPAGFQTVSFNGVGDFDGDGYPDYIAGRDRAAFGDVLVEVYSPHLDRPLFSVFGPRTRSFGYACIGDVDLDGDGLKDVVACGLRRFNGGDIRAFDHYGNPIWTIASTMPGATGTWFLTLMGFPDLDGDGCGEVIVGGVDYTLPNRRGFVAVLSGRRGTLLRIHFDPQIEDIIGEPLTRAGDVDRDGVEDYATGSYWSAGTRTVAMVFSGATGSVLQTLQSTSHDIASTLMGGRDVDLDGIPDLIAGSVGFANGTAPPGRMQVFSGRDGQVLLQTQAGPRAQPGYYAAGLIDLGTPPGSPYPTIGLFYVPTNALIALEVWRLSPPGATAVGAGCASSGAVPSISIRRVEDPTGDRARLLLSSAPPGARALCVASDIADSSWSGLALPIDLAPFGFTGCALRVAPFLGECRSVGLAGVDLGCASIDLPYQLDPSGMGAALQWLTLDPATGAYAATPRLEVHVR